jgi:hypothetical protein
MVYGEYGGNTPAPVNNKSLKYVPELRPRPDAAKAAPLSLDVKSSSIRDSKMALPNSYTVKPGSIPAYFEAMLEAEAPERFSTRFLERLDFKSTNDRLFIGVLKELGFIDADGVPTERYYEFLDRSQSEKIVAEGIKEAYSDLFAINTNAQNLSVEEVKNKLRTLYKGSKKDNLINRIASTFIALCDYADFTPRKTEAKREPTPSASSADTGKEEGTDYTTPPPSETPPRRISLDALQYHINIVLPESRDQAVYDAIFKSLRDHLGRK